MAEFATTDADTIREAIATAITSIVPRHAARRSDRFVRAKNQEISGGSQFRLFDVELEAEREQAGDQFAGAWHGGGIVYGAEATITVSYSAATHDVRRWAGSDGQDIAAVLVDLHTTIPGMFAISASGPGPVLDGPEISGPSGRHLAVFRVFVTFFVSDTVAVA